MERWFILLFFIGQCPMSQGNCSPPMKFYADCSRTRTFAEAFQFCATHLMTVINLTNSSGTLVNDINFLNQTLVSQNCTGYFWFSSGNQTGLAANVADLGSLLGSLLTGVLNVVLCLIPFLCPATTTPAPITSALTVCTRSVQQSVIQKCSNQIIRSDMQTFHFQGQMMGVGLLDSFTLQSLSACSALCSVNNTCIGVSYSNGICNLYM